MQARLYVLLWPISVIAHDAAPVRHIDISQLFSAPLLLVLMATTYFLLIRPPMQANRAHNKLLASLQEGRDIQLTSGIIGTITAISECYVRIQIDNLTTLSVDKRAIQQLLPDNTVRDQLS